MHRITLFGRNVSDLVQEIHRIVSARREQVEDRQIQQLYQKR